MIGSREVVVGVDLGGTKSAGAVVGADGAVGQSRSIPTPARHGPAAVLDAVAGLVCDLAARVPAGTIVRGVGVGTAGSVYVAAGRIVSAPDLLRGWAGTSIADELHVRIESRFGPVAVHVQNDVDAHAAGEAWIGAASGLDTVLVIAVGTGVGGAVVIGGKPLRGAHHVAGEIGHVPTPGAEGLRCGCGRLGHLEALGSGPSLHRHYLALGGTSAASDAREVIALAAEGHAIASRAVASSAAAVGRGAAAVVTVLDPDAVLITGGLAGAGQQWWSAMEAALRAELVDPLAAIPVLAAALGNDAAIVGAARGAWDLLGVSSWT